MKLRSRILKTLCFSSSPISKITTNIFNNGVIKQLTIQAKIKLGLKPSIADLNPFLSFLFHSEKFNLSLHFFSQITSNSIKPNRKSHSIAAEALLKLYNGSKDAGNFILHMENFRIKPQNDILDFVIWKSCMVEKDHVFSFNLFQEFVRNHAFVPSYNTLYTLIVSIGYNGDLGTALKVFNLMSERNENYPYWNYICSLIITRFCKIDKLEFGIQIYERIKKIDGFSSNLVTYTSLIHALCKDNKIKEACDMVHEMENKGIIPDNRTYNILINGLCKIGEVYKANEILQKVIADNFIYSTLLHGFIKEKDELNIMEIKSKIEKSDFNMDINTCNALIKALFTINKNNDAYEVFVTMPERGLIANCDTFCIIINKYRDIGEFDNLLEIFEDYIESSLSLCSNYNNNDNNNNSNNNNNNCMVDMAYDIFNELLKGNLSPDLNELLLDINLDQFRENGAEKVLNIVKKIDKIENDSIFSIICNFAIILLSMLNCPNYASEIYIILQKRGLKITNNTSFILIKSLMENKIEKYTILGLFCQNIRLYPNSESKMGKIISQYCEVFNDINQMIIKHTKEGRIKEAYNFIEKNTKNGVFIDISSYILVIDKLCKVGYIEKALDLCENMKNAGVKLNIIIYNLILNGLCKEGCLIEAFRLLNFIEENDLNLRPTIYTYAPLIATLCKEGLLKDAQDLFVKMLERNISPNIFVINLIINGFCQLGLVDDALIFLSNNIEKYLIRPDDFTISSILRGYYYKGDVEMSFKYYKEYIDKNIFPDFFGFMYLINGFYSKGRLEETRGVIKEMLTHTEIKAMVNKYGNEIYKESLVSLLLVACDQGRIKEVINILKEVGLVYNSNLKDLKEGIVDLKFEFDVKNCEVLREKSFNDDFEEYYLIMKELCEKGEIKEVNSLINMMIMNSEVK